MHEEYILGTSTVCTWFRCYLWWPWVLQQNETPRSILWAIFSNSTSWIFQSMQLKLLVNMCHYTFCCKHVVVPSVASGKSVKLRSPFICCNVVESLLCECELKNFEAFNSWFLKVSQLWIMYSVTSAFSQCGLNSSGVNSETLLVYGLKTNGHTNFPKVWEPPLNCRYQQHGMKQVLLLTVNRYATVQNVVTIAILHLVFVHPYIESARACVRAYACTQ